MYKIGDKVIVSNDLTLTDQRHGLAWDMQDMRGKMYKVQSIHKQDSVKLCHESGRLYIFHMDNVRSARKQLELF